MNNMKITKEDIIEQFGYGHAFSSKELFEFYKKSEEDLDENTFRWRVYVLKKNRLLSNVKRGVYVLDHKKKFQPEISRSIKILYNMIKNRFPYIEISVWETSWLDNFMNHQIYNSFTIFEVDKEVVNSVYNLLKEKRDRVYMNPSEKDVENYIHGENAIVIRPLVKEAPIQDIGKVKVSKLEKILVDLYFDKILLTSYQGNEMKHIFKRSFDEYEINFTTLYRYARNRSIKDKFKEYLQQELGIVPNGLGPKEQL
jgi:hypothetical protein